MKKIILPFSILMFLGINSNAFSQNIHTREAKTHRKVSQNVNLEKSAERNAATRERQIKEKQKNEKTIKKNQSVDFETLKNLRRTESSRRANISSSHKVEKSNRSFPAPYVEAHGKKVIAKKYSKDELQVFEQKKQAQQSRTSLERKSLATPSEKTNQTAYTKESLHKSIAELEQRIFCAEENGTMKASELAKIKTALSNREKLLKTLK